MTDIYKSIASPSEGLYKDNGSRFIAFARPVESEEEAREAVAALRREYHDARHHCFAYRIGLEGTLWRANDDGEPSGSAGRPILGQIDSAGLSDVLITVVRYFGGVKLGIPGLIRAYRSASADALASAQVVEKVAGSWFRAGFSYDALPMVMKAAKEMDLPQRRQDFGNACTLELRVRRSLQDDFLERMNKYCTFIGCLTE